MTLNRMELGIHACTCTSKHARTHTQIEGKNKHINMPAYILAYQHTKLHIHKLLETTQTGEQKNLLKSPGLHC